MLLQRHIASAAPTALGKAPIPTCPPTLPCPAGPGRQLHQCGHHGQHIRGRQPGGGHLRGRSDWQVGGAGGRAADCAARPPSPSTAGCKLFGRHPGGPGDASPLHGQMRPLANLPPSPPARMPSASAPTPRSPVRAGTRLAAAGERFMHIFFLRRLLSTLCEHTPWAAAMELAGRCLGAIGDAGGIAVISTPCARQYNVEQADINSIAPQIQCLLFLFQCLCFRRDFAIARALSSAALLWRAPDQLDSVVHGTVRHPFIVACAPWPMRKSNSRALSLSRWIRRVTGA